jgi:hypothetical protein
MRGDPTVNSLEETINQWNPTEPRQRQRPPNLPGEEQNCSCSADDSPGGGEHFHFLERGSGVQIELSLHPWGLERHKFKTATL